MALRISSNLLNVTANTEASGIDKSLYRYNTSITALAFQLIRLGDPLYCFKHITENVTLNPRLIWYHSLILPCVF